MTRPHHLRRTTVLALAAALAMGAAPMLAQAQGAGGDGEGISFVTPFPDKDTYRVQVYGDGQADGLASGLVEALADDQRIQVQRRYRPFPSLWRADFEEEAKALETELGREPPHIAVVLLGANDRQPWRQPNGRRSAIGGTEWRAEYGRRAERLMRAFRSKGVAVYWVGHPVQRRSDSNDEVQAQNDVFREHAFATGVRFIDVYASFQGENGGWSAWGPDVTGKSRMLRDPDGGGYTGAGYRKVAFFVEREVKRDVSSARNERTIPLAGSEAEQARVRSAKAQPAPVIAAPGAASQPKSGMAATAPAPSRAPAVRPGDLPVETSSVTLPGGPQDAAATITIVRPAIPVSVLTAVTRRESPDKASQLGDTLMAEVLGGLTVVSTVSQAGDGSQADRRKQSPTGTAYFRVLVKGERLSPRPGRSDDLPWPRPEILPSEKAERTPPAAAPAKAPDAPAARAPLPRQRG